jgi:hypothetical protein
VKRGLCLRAEDWEWSSYWQYATGCAGTVGREKAGKGGRETRSSGGTLHLGKRIGESRESGSDCESVGPLRGLNRVGGLAARLKPCPDTNRAELRSIGPGRGVRAYVGVARDGHRLIVALLMGMAEPGGGHGAARYSFATRSVMRPGSALSRLHSTTTVSLSSR